MTRVDPHAFASNLVWLAQRVVDAVDTQDQAQITRAVRMARTLTAPEGQDTADALIVLLASALKGRSVEALVGWVQRWGDELDYVTPAPTRAQQQAAERERDEHGRWVA